MYNSPQFSVISGGVSKLALSLVSQIFVIDISRISFLKCGLFVCDFCASKEVIGYLLVKEGQLFTTNASK